MTARFEVQGPTPDAIKLDAVAILNSFFGSHAWRIKSFDVEPLVWAEGSSIPKLWTAHVEAESNREYR